ESSGLAASRAHPGVYWTHNDSDDGPYVYAVDAATGRTVATVRAVGAAHGRAFTPAETEDFLRGIEPADGVMYDEIVAFHHREVRLGRRLGVLPPLAVVAHDEGGQVDTVAHNRGARAFDAADREEYALLLDRLTDAVARGDLPEVGAVATRSAEMNAHRRRRAGFAELHALCREVDGLGLVLAHSGTMLGVLLEANDPALTGKTEHIRAGCAALGGEVSVHRSLGADDSWSPQAAATAHPTELEI
ncbi:kinase, partial [Streptomyces sp. NPDC054840]